MADETPADCTNEEKSEAVDEAKDDTLDPAPKDNIKTAPDETAPETATTTTTTQEKSSTSHAGEKRPFNRLSEQCIDTSRRWKVEWIPQSTMARIEFTQKQATISLAGRGSVCCREGTIWGHGFWLQPGQWYPFECPKWSSWLVLETESDKAIVEIRNRSWGQACQTHEATQNRHGPALPPQPDNQDPYNHHQAPWSTFSLHDTNDPQSRPTLVLPCWRTTAEQILAHSTDPTVSTDQTTTPNNIIAVAGAKGVGKSTFVRYLLHRLLSQKQQVYVLDGDTGQAEFGPPGSFDLDAHSPPRTSLEFTP